MTVTKFKFEIDLKDLKDVELICLRSKIRYEIERRKL